MNRRHFSTVRAFTGALILAASAFAASPAGAQSAPVLLLLDQNAIAANQAPNMFTAADINATIAGVGVRDPMSFFMRRTGQNVALPGGPAGHEGWFAPTTLPSAWTSASGVNDAAQNFMLAGPGLGSPDSSGDRSSLLGNVQNIAPLDAAKLQALTGREICAVVFAGEIPWTPAGTSLKGSVTGIVALSILTVSAGTGLPVVTLRVLDDGLRCGGALSLASF
jgi:hypothetical protein